MKAAVPLAAARHPVASGLRRWLGGRDVALAALNFVLLVAVALKFPNFVAPANIADLLDDTRDLVTKHGRYRKNIVRGEQHVRVT